MTSQRDHYSYAHYADPDVADEFDAKRFGGPIGRHLADVQAKLLSETLAPLQNRRIVDVGTGTGRAAVGLAARGAHLIGLDFSQEMLRVARGRARREQLAVALARADAHALPLGDRSVDAAVSLRVLMHAIDWRRCIAELCRVTRWRVVVDFPSSASLAALESAARRWRERRGANVEAYRVMSLAEITAAFAMHRFRLHSAHRQFVLPIALHKKVGRIGITKAVEGGLGAVGLLRLFGSPVTTVFERDGS